MNIQRDAKKLAFLVALCYHATFSIYSHFPLIPRQVNTLHDTHFCFVHLSPEIHSSCGLWCKQIACMKQRSHILRTIRRCKKIWKRWKNAAVKVDTPKDSFLFNMVRLLNTLCIWCATWFWIFVNDSKVAKMKTKLGKIRKTFGN